MIRLADLVKREGSLSPRQVGQVRRWLADDWETADLGRDVVKLIKRMLATIDLAASRPR